MPTVSAPAPTRRNYLRWALLCLAVLILLLLAFVLFLWHNELSTLFSIRQRNAADGAHQDGSVHEMHVSGGYYFDDFLAQGGARNDGELIAFITGRITKGLIPMQIHQSDIGCSSFTATDGQGHRLFARNYDFSRTNTCIVHTDPGGGRHASVSTVDLQFIGIDEDAGVQALADKVLMLAAPYVPLDGVNDAGVACGIYMSYQGKQTAATDQCTDRPDLTSTTMLRLILDYADSVEEAVELVAAYDLHDSANSSFHYMVADATGASAVLEWVAATDSTDNDGAARQLRVTYRDGAPFQVVTNYILAPGYYDGEPEQEQKGLDRYQHLHSALTASRGAVADEQAAMELLAQVGRRSWKGDGDSDSVTVHSVVYDLTDCTALWVGNEHYGEDGYTYPLSAN